MGSANGQGGSRLHEERRCGPVLCRWSPRRRWPARPHRAERRGNHHLVSAAMTSDEKRATAIAQSMGERIRHASDLPSMDRESIEVLIAAGEWAVALETLCTQLYEYDLEPSAEERAQLEALGRELDVP